MRSRSRSTTPVYSYMEQTDKNGAYSKYGPWLTDSDSESIVDVVTDHYQRRIADGEIINNPCTYSRTHRHTDGVGSYHAVFKSNGYWYQQTGAVTYAWMSYYPGSLGLSSTVPSEQVSRAILTLKQQAIANIAKSPWSFGEDVAEVRETLRYLKNPAASLAEVSKAFERKARNLYYRYGNRTKALAGAWASYRFAMLPLQRSLEDIVKSSFERNKKEFAAGSRLSARSKSTLSGNFSETKAIGYARFAQTRTDEINLHAYILYETKNPLKGWQYRYGLRLRDIPTTGWQLVPYSFMVDRVANVSNCISGITNLSDPSIRILASGFVTKTDSKYSCQLLADTNPQWTVTADCDTHHNDTFTYVREPWTPTVSDTIPQVDLSGLVKDATSVMDLLSLVTLRLKCF